MEHSARKLMVAASRREWRCAALALGAWLLVGCGFTVTSDRPPYADLDQKEKDAVDVIIRELTAFNAQIKARTKYSIDEVIDKERIDVSFEGLIFSANIGDNVIHVATWENLSDAQRTTIQGWWKCATLAATEQSYKKFFYQFMALMQGVKQYMYKALTPTWLFQHRTLFSMEKDSVRTSLAHYAAVGRSAEMWNFVTALCAPVKAQHTATYEPNFNKQYLAAHVTELANPENPVGYMYFICRWVDLGKAEAMDLTVELNWLRDLPLP